MAQGLDVQILKRIQDSSMQFLTGGHRNNASESMSFILYSCRELGTEVESVAVRKSSYTFLERGC